MNLPKNIHSTMDRVLGRWLEDNPDGYDDVREALAWLEENQPSLQGTWKPLEYIYMRDGHCLLTIENNGSRLCMYHDIGTALMVDLPPGLRMCNNIKS